MLAHPEQKPRRRHTDPNRNPVDLIQMRQDGHQHFRERMAMRAYPQNVFHLACCDQNPGRGDKTCDDGMAEEIG